MDKEMQAKIDEIVKAHGRQQLNPDDLDKVVGGADCPDDYTLNGMTWQEAGAILQTLIDNFGVDVAISFANEKIGKTDDWSIFLRMGQNAGYYACGMIWSKAWKKHNGGSGF